MSKSLTDIFIADSYQGVLHSDTGIPYLETSQIYDGIGTPTALFVGRTTVSIEGQLSASNIGATSSIYTPTLNAINIVASANITGSGIYGTNINATNIHASHIHGDYLYGTTLSATNVNGTNVNGVDIFGTRFISAGSSVTAPVIRGTEISGTEIFGNTVSGNTVYGTDVRATGLSARSATVDNILIKGCTFSNNSLIDKIYPIGSVYFSVVQTNPASLIGGIWESIATGKFVVGAGTASDSNSVSKSFIVGNNAGEYDHTLTESEMPSHTHLLKSPGGNQFYLINDSLNDPPGSIDSAAGVIRADGPDQSNDAQYCPVLPSVGGGTSHSQTPPSFGMYMWKRIQ